MKGAIKVRGSPSGEKPRGRRANAWTPPIRSQMVLTSKAIRIRGPDALNPIQVARMPDHSLLLGSISSLASLQGQRGSL